MGEGPARYLARAGFAGIQVDGPVSGLRNTTGSDEQFLTFNVGNLGAMRDNIRESAVELSIVARVGIALHVDASNCPGAGGADVTFDANHVAIMGHSMGSWIAPIALTSNASASVPASTGARVRASRSTSVVVTGGGTWIRTSSLPPSAWWTTHCTSRPGKRTT